MTASAGSIRHGLSLSTICLRPFKYRKAMKALTTPIVVDGRMSDLAAVRNVLDGAAFPGGTKSDVVRGVETLIRDGQPLPGSIRELGNRGASGRLQAMTVSNGMATQEVVTKSRELGSLRERKAFNLSRAMRIDHHFPKVALVEDDVARITMVPGEQARSAGIRNAADIEQMINKQIASLPAGKALQEVERKALARMERELLQVFDYLTANTTRHRRNVLADTETGAIFFIDHGGMGIANGKDPLVPKILSYYQLPGRGGRVELDPATIEFLKKNLNEDIIRKILTEGGEEASLRVDDVIARFNHVVDTGGYSYRRSLYSELTKEPAHAVMDRLP